MHAVRAEQDMVMWAITEICLTTTTEIYSYHYSLTLWITWDYRMQIGLSETTVMRDYHKDALDRYNVTCDFPTVIRELVDPHKRFPFQACFPLPIAPAQKAVSLHGRTWSSAPLPGPCLKQPV